MLGQRNKELSAHLLELFPNDIVQHILLHEGTEREIILLDYNSSLNIQLTFMQQLLQI